MISVLDSWADEYEFDSKRYEDERVTMPPLRKRKYLIGKGISELERLTKLINLVDSNRLMQYRPISANSERGKGRILYDFDVVKSRVRKIRV